MARGKKWDKYEKQLAAKAWLRASYNSIQGCDMRSKTFQEIVFRYFKEMEPPCTDPLKYSNRGCYNLWSCLRDNIFRDCQKFGEAMMVIERSKPTGNLDEVDIHCLAIAYHKKITRGIDYSYTTRGKNALVPENEWSNYLAWLELCTHPKFQKNINYNPLSPSGFHFDEEMDAVPNETNNSKDNNKNNSSSFNEGTIDDDSSVGSGTPKKVNSEDLPSRVSSSSSNTYYGKKKTKALMSEQKAKDEQSEKESIFYDNVSSLAHSNKEMLHIMKNSKSVNVIKDNISFLKMQYNILRKTDKVAASKIQQEILQAAVEGMKKSDAFDKENSEPTQTTLYETNTKNNITSLEEDNSVSSVSYIDVPKVVTSRKKLPPIYNGDIETEDGENSDMFLFDDNTSHVDVSSDNENIIGDSNNNNNMVLVDLSNDVMNGNENHLNHNNVKFVTGINIKKKVMKGKDKVNDKVRKVKDKVSKPRKVSNKTKIKTKLLPTSMITPASIITSFNNKENPGIPTSYSKYNNNLNLRVLI